MAGQQREKAEVVKDFVGEDFKGVSDFDYDGANKLVMPINALTPFAGKQWLVKARVLEKQPVRQWRNAKGTGFVTNVTIMDENGTAIRTTLFNEGVTKYWRMLQVGKVFFFGPSTRSAQSVRAANKQFSSLQHDYELALDESSTIQPVQAHDAAVKAIATETKANFLRFSEVGNRLAGSTTDIRGVVVQVGAMTDVVQKSTGATIKRRVIQLCDNSGTSGSQVDLTLFEDQAKAVPAALKNGTAVIARGMRVAHYRGTASLTAPRECNISWLADCPDLSKWWTEDGKALALKGYLVNVSQAQEDTRFSEVKGAFRLGLSAIEEQKMGFGERPDWINTKVTVMGFAEKEDRMQYYDACPNMVDDQVRGEKRMCGKKVENFAPGSKVHCQKCDATIDHVVTKYIVGVRVADHTTERWTTLFDEVGNEFFGTPASSIKENPAALDSLKQQLKNTQITMTLKVKERVTPDGTMRMDSQCMRLRKLQSARDFTVDCRNMLNDLERYHAGETSEVQIP